LLDVPGSELYFWSKKVELSGLEGEAPGKKVERWRSEGEG